MLGRAGLARRCMPREARHVIQQLNIGTPLSLQVLGSNLVLEDLELPLAVSFVQQGQPEAFLQLQRLTAQRHNLVHLHCTPGDTTGDHIQCC